ncbi:ribokinase [Gordonia araii NBRC 100433]|uniref:Ribokinase n=1 Tax=Gordonia araii NBRC 100433 TaxID=1073574 RepID=G7GXH0_9ACTN|nr:ribokinase [Gordonia araii]NNG95919.1 ribokinase [Gordonia araii NBRC 100433]GAB08295.1 ribokinase [Gordonia araii NBRC 100433]
MGVPISQTPYIVVVGSMVFDLSIQLDRMPAPHETVLADSVALSCGGKGLCQALAISRLGGECAAVGRVGSDYFGDEILSLLRADGVDTAFVLRDPSGTHLGIPMITADGVNQIIGIPRASNSLTPDDIEKAEEYFKRADALVVQNETPLPTIAAAIDAAERHGAIVVWNTAPARYSLADTATVVRRAGRAWLTPNETEAHQLTGIEVVDAESGFAAADAIRAAIPSTGVIITMGAEGAIAIDEDGKRYRQPAFAVESVDPTAAGDTFTGAFTTALTRGAPPPLALEFAAAAGALCVTARGAAPSIPTKAAVDELLAHG